MVGQMRGGLQHAARGAGWADATTFAGVDNAEVVPARSEAGTGEAVGEHDQGVQATNTPRWVMPVAPLDLVLRGAQHGILTR